MSNIARSPLTGKMVTSGWVEGDFEWSWFREDSEQMVYVVSRRLLRGDFENLNDHDQARHLATGRSCKDSDETPVFMTLDEFERGVLPSEKQGPYKPVCVVPRS